MENSKEYWRYKALKLICENGSIADKVSAVERAETFYRYIVGCEDKNKDTVPQVGSNQNTGSGQTSVRKQSRKRPVKVTENLQSKNNEQ